jgi:hypothetical protein
MSQQSQIIIKKRTEFIEVIDLRNSIILKVYDYLEKNIPGLVDKYKEIGWQDVEIKKIQKKQYIITGTIRQHIIHVVDNLWEAKRLQRKLLRESV